MTPPNHVLQRTAGSSHHAVIRVYDQAARKVAVAGRHPYRFYTQFDELLASPLLAVLLFGLLGMHLTN